MDAPRILVVDDDNLSRWSVSKVLGRAGYRVEGAASAGEGLAVARGEPPDLVLLDIRLPDMDGLSVLRTFREFHPELPVLMMTADASRETARQAFRLGAHGYLEKPIGAAVLRAAAGRALEARPRQATSGKTEA